MLHKSNTNDFQADLFEWYMVLLLLIKSGADSNANRDYILHLSLHWFFTACQYVKGYFKLRGQGILFRGFLSDLYLSQMVQSNNF